MPIGKHKSKNMKPMMYPKNPIDGKSHAELKAAGGKAFAIHKADHAKGVFPKAHHSKNMHPMDGHEPNKYPQSNKFIGELTKAKKAGKKSFNVGGKTYPVTGSGASKYVMNIGSKEVFNVSPFNLRSQQLMNYAPANKGAVGYKPLDEPDYTAIEQDAGSEENGDGNGNENENKPKPKTASDRLSEARKKRKAARANLKADRLIRRANRMEARRKK